MIDIHCHMIPGIDDGSPHIEASLEMAVMAVESGVDTLICTPHANQVGRFENFAGRQLQERFLHLRDIVQREGIPLDLYLGQEIYSGPDMGEKIQQRRLISLNHSGYYLIEFDFEEEAEMIEHYIETVFRCGGIPILAHPERYTCVQEQPGRIYYWMKGGVLTQVNKGSLFGRFGRDAYETVRILLDHGLVNCVATDAHSPYVRTTHMTEAREWLEKYYGMDQAHRLTMTAPERIITGQRLPFKGREIHEGR